MLRSLTLKIFGRELMELQFIQHEAPPLTESSVSVKDTPQPPGYSSHMGGSFENAYACQGRFGFTL